MVIKLLDAPRSALRLAALLVLALALVGAAAKPRQAPQEAQRLIALGDVHGDYDAYRALLSEAGLINASGHWSGGKTILVQMGDAVDRGPRSRDIVLHLQRLQKEAPRQGGRVIALIGNHEAMNMIGDLRYVPPAEYQAYVTPGSESLRERVYREGKAAIESRYRQSEPGLSEAEIKAKWLKETPLGYIEHRQAWAPNGAIGKWVLSSPAVLIIKGFLFVHGGISSKYARYSVDEINQMVRAALAEPAQAQGGVLEDEQGPLWYRGHVDENEITAAEVAQVLEAFGVKCIIIAHTPNLTGIRVLHGGRVIDVDTGITAFYGGTRSFLSFEGAGIFAHDNGKVTELKSAEAPQ